MFILPVRVVKCQTRQIAYNGNDWWFMNKLAWSDNIHKPKCANN